jgi:hypothetical protein
VKPTKIFLAVPAMTGTVHVGIMDFLAKVRGGLFKYKDRVIELEAGFVAHVSPVEAARNALVWNFLSTDCEWLFFVDADCYPAETGLMIFDALDKADIIAGRVTIWMPIRGDDGEVSGWHLQPTAASRVEAGAKYLIHDVGGGEIKYDIGGAGTGCLLIHRRVLEDRRMWGSTDYIDSDGEHKQLGETEPPPIFRTTYRPNGRRIVGEDYLFTSTAKALGYKLAYVPYAHWHHSKAISLLDVERYSNKCYENGFRFGAENAVGEKTA